MAAPHPLLITGVLATICGLGAVSAGLAPLKLEAASRPTFRADGLAVATATADHVRQRPLANASATRLHVRASGEPVVPAHAATTQRAAVTTMLPGTKVTELLGGQDGTGATHPAGTRASPLFDRRNYLLRTAAMLHGRREGGELLEDHHHEPSLKTLADAAACGIAVHSQAATAAMGCQPESIESVVASSDHQGGAVS